MEVILNQLLLSKAHRISPLSKFTESLTEVSLSQIQIIAFIDYKNYFRMFIAPSLR